MTAVACFRLIVVRSGSRLIIIIIRSDNRAVRLGRSSRCRIDRWFIRLGRIYRRLVGSRGIMSIRINRRISWFSRLYRRADIGIDDPIFVNLGRVACDLILTKSIVNTCAFIKARNITKAPLPIISGCYGLLGDFLPSASK